MLKDGDKVIGVEYEKDGKKYTEHGAVILATGGYAADFTADSLLKKHRPEYYDLVSCVPETLVCYAHAQPTTNGDHCTGDGHKMAMSIGAKGIDLEKVQVHPTGLVDPKDPDAKVSVVCGVSHVPALTNRSSSLLPRRSEESAACSSTTRATDSSMSCSTVTLSPTRCGRTTRFANGFGIRSPI